MNRFFDNLPFIGKYVSGKVVLSFLMLVLSVTLCLIVGTTDRTLCVWAMAFSFVGDIILSYNHEHGSKSKKLFALGGTAFIIAHLFYCLTYNTKIKSSGYPFFNAGVILVILILAGITYVITYEAKTTRFSKLYFFCLIYLWLTGISYMTVFSYAISAQSTAFLALIGGLSFLASDVIIGCEKLLNLRSKFAREMVWWLYPFGQILLIMMA